MGLALYAYNLATGASTDYSTRVSDLTISTVAPGGFGDLACTIDGIDPREVPQELTVFCNVAVMDPNTPNTPTGAVFLGRWDEPGLALNDQQAGLVLHAMGAATCLKDDPDDVSYLTKTAQFIMGQELSRRANYLLLDQDTSQILPDAPSTTFSPAYNGQTIEDELNDLSQGLGDYQWCVWDHPTHKDACGFPTWQLYWHQRDTSTVTYTAHLEDIESWDVRPAVEYSFNVVTLTYRDATSRQPASVTVKDSRLNANGSQGNAPFPWRRLRQQMNETLLSSTQATAIANALLGLYSDGNYKISVTLSRLRDANNNPIPLYAARADGNLFLPDLSGAFGHPLATTATSDAATANLFYITETQYSESSGQTPTLELTLNSYQDSAAYQFARLQYKAAQQAKSGKVGVVVQGSGAQEKGYVSHIWSNATSGGNEGTNINYKTVFSARPLSVSFDTSGLSQAGYSGSPLSGNFSQFGCDVYVNTNASGGGYFHCYYTTSGNCFVGLDPDAEVFDWHCDRCEQLAVAAHGCEGCAKCHEHAVHRGLSLHEHVYVDTSRGADPGHAAMAVLCPRRCGYSESWNTALTAEDEDPTAPGNWQERADHARLIRAVMAHPAIGLRRHGDLAPAADAPPPKQGYARRVSPSAAPQQRARKEDDPAPTS